MCAPAPGAGPPTTGATPPLLLGRQWATDRFSESIDNGPGAPDLLTLVTGARGIGKTVMLTELGDVARGRGWVVIDETATRGVMERLAAQADQRRVELGFPEWSRVKGAGLANLFTVQMDLPDRAARMWRDRIGALSLSHQNRWLRGQDRRDSAGRMGAGWGGAHRSRTPRFAPDFSVPSRRSPPVQGPSW